MFDGLSRGIAISALVLGALGIGAIVTDRAERLDLVAIGARAGSEAEAAATLRRSVSAGSGASAGSGVSVSAGASARSGVGAGDDQGAGAGVCAAEAFATVERDGRRMTARDSMRSENERAACRAEASHNEGRADAE
ncbi:MAG: hypothetical protein ACQEUZ_04420 [Pseudomonadota bacterium]